MMRVYPPCRSLNRAAIESKSFFTTSGSGTIESTCRRAWRVSCFASVTM